MNDVSNRAVREFSEFLNSIEADFPKPTCPTAYEIHERLVGSEMCIRDRIGSATANAALPARMPGLSWA